MLDVGYFSQIIGNKKLHLGYLIKNTVKQYYCDRLLKLFVALTFINHSDMMICCSRNELSMFKTVYILFILFELKILI